MAKMTLSQLKTNVQTYVNAAVQGGAWSKTTNNMYGLIDKIGKQVTIDGDVKDKLAMMDGDELPFGKTIEEYFLDMTLPAQYGSDGTMSIGNMTAEGAKNVVPELPSVETVVYSTTLGRKKIKTTVPYDNFERAALGAEEAGNLVAKIYSKLNDSYTLYKYAVKKQLLGKLGDLCTASGAGAGLSQAIAIPEDATTAEDFIQAVMESVEVASDVSEGHSLSGALIGAAPSMTLYVKQGVIPAVRVKAMAGAFNKEDIAIPAKVVVVSDFGKQTNDGVFAILADDRAIKLHQGYHAVRTSENADGDFVNIVDHSEHTGFISKYAFVKAFKATN